MTREYFGTDGIRGVANEHPMTAEMALQLGRALTAFLKSKNSAPRIIIGKDTRRSGYMLETALTAGIASMGGRAFLLGPLPTPSVAYHIRGMRAQGGVMISASHNPFMDNGLKVFTEEGFKLSDEDEIEIEALMKDQKKLESLKPTPEQLGKASRLDDALGRYLVNLKSMFGRDFDLNGMKIVYDGANGAAYDCGVKLFEELGAEVIAVACKPNGLNINRDCAQEDPKLLGNQVLQHRADLGIAVDGDADRLLMVDEAGEHISGEHLMFELALFLKRSNRLKKDLLVTTSMSNEALIAALQSEGLSCLRTEVGDRYVTKALREKDAIFGGENSGHYIFLDQNTTADGLFSSLEVLALLRMNSWKASRLHQSFELLPQHLENIPVREKRPIDDLPKLQSLLKSIERKYQNQGRINVRYSGTQDMMRVMIEGPNADDLKSDCESIRTEVLKEIG